MAALMSRCLALFMLAALVLAGPATAQRIDDLARSGRTGDAACRHKLAQMLAEARYYDRMKADLPGMEKQAAELQARHDLLLSKVREASTRRTALEQEREALGAELPKADAACREAWFPSMSGACSRRSEIARRLDEDVNPALGRLRTELPPLEEERLRIEGSLSVLQMNLQSRRSYIVRATRPADAEIAEQQEICRALELTTGRDPDSSGSALAIVASAAEGVAGDEITLRARLVAPVTGAQYGFVWSLNGRVFGGNGDLVKVTIPGEGTSTIRVAAWRWTGGQWLKAAEASRSITGRARVLQTVAITGPNAVMIRDGAGRGTFEAKISPQVSGELYGFTWGATGDPQGPVVFNNQSHRQSLTVTTPGRYALLVHAWKLVNGQWLFIGKASLPFTAR